MSESHIRTFSDESRLFSENCFFNSPNPRDKQHHQWQSFDQQTNFCFIFKFILPSIYHFLRIYIYKSCNNSNTIVITVATHPSLRLLCHPRVAEKLAVRLWHALTAKELIYPAITVARVRGALMGINRIALTWCRKNEVDLH